MYQFWINLWPSLYETILPKIYSGTPTRPALCDDNILHNVIGSVGACISSNLSTNCARTSALDISLFDSFFQNYWSKLIGISCVIQKRWSVKVLENKFFGGLKIREEIWTLLLTFYGWTSFYGFVSGVETTIKRAFNLWMDAQYFRCNDEHFT